MTPSRMKLFSRSKQATPSASELFDEIRELTRQNREQRDPERDRRILWLRHLAGIELMREAAGEPQFAEPDFDAVKSRDSKIIEIAPDELTPSLLRAAILSRGCLLVRGLVERDEALGLAQEIEAAYTVRAESGSGGNGAGGLYEEFHPQPPYEFAAREWIEMGGGLLAVDSPPTLFTIFDALDRVGFLDVVRGYLGEPPLLSVEKSTLRKATPDVPGNWHQDGSFLGDVRVLNLWLSLSRCGDESPGLDIVPRRLDLLPAGVEGTNFPIQVLESTVEEAAGDDGILRPIFEPGDALLFDEVFLHKTGSDPRMPKPRYALESWFFGRSAFSPEYAPVAV
jgi:hypothetical protein